MGLSAVVLLAPLGLALLALLPVIVWLHLRQRPGRRVVVPSIAPWLALAATAAGRRWRPPTSWLLAVQLLVAGCAALAVAQPVLPGGALAAVDRVVVVDVSTSMLAEGVWGQAREMARELLASARGEVSLVTLGPRPRVLVLRGPGAGPAVAALSALAPGGIGGDVEAALALARSVGGPATDVVVVTDGRLAPPAAAMPGVRWRVVGQAADNVAIVDAAPGQDGDVPRLFARVVNLGETPVRTPLQLLVDGRLWQETAVDLAPGETHEALWDLPPWGEIGEVRLVHVDALAVDNRAVVPLRSAPRRIQWSGSSAAVERALAALPHTELQPVGPATYRTDGSADVSVFVGPGPTVLPPGGVLLVNPESGGVLPVRGDRRAVTVATMGDAALLDGLDLAGVELFNVPALDLPPWAETWLAVDGRPVVVAGRQGPSSVVALLFDPDAGEVAGRLAFPILMARAVASVAAEAGGSATIPAGAVWDGVRPGWRAVVGPNGVRRTIAGPLDDTGVAGLYRFETVLESSSPALGVLAGDLLESDLRSPLTSLPAGAVESGGSHADLWSWLVAGALALMVAEALLRRYRARQSKPGIGGR